MRAPGPSATGPPPGAADGGGRPQGQDGRLAPEGGKAGFHPAYEQHYDMCYEYYYEVTAVDGPPATEGCRAWRSGLQPANEEPDVALPPERTEALEAPQWDWRILEPALGEPGRPSRDRTQSPVEEALAEGGRGPPQRREAEEHEESGHVPGSVLDGGP